MEYLSYKPEPPIQSLHPVDPGADTAPFPAELDLLYKLTDPSILAHAAQDDSLKAELSCPLLDAMHEYLHIVARKNSTHIDALHSHVYEGRRVKVTEDPGLHLVWLHDTIYVKPLPPQLLSHAFWRYHLGVGSPHRAAAIGFVRSYGHLIQHRSDFLIAQREDLIPASASMTHGDFDAFIRCFREIPDQNVAQRWHFGQLRLSRLNWAVRLLQPQVEGRRRGVQNRLYYQEHYWTQTDQFLREFAAPLLFAFAALSLVLAAMQVVLAAREESPWPAFSAVSAWFSVLTILGLVVVCTCIVVIVFVVLAAQISFGLRNKP